MYSGMVGNKGGAVFAFLARSPLAFWLWSRVPVPQPSAAWEGAAVAFRPRPARLGAMLSDIVRVFGQRRAAVVLGVPAVTVRTWVRRGLQAEASRRLVWLTWTLLFHPEHLPGLLDLVLWGGLRGRRRSHHKAPPGRAQNFKSCVSGHDPAQIPGPNPPGAAPGATPGPPTG